MMKRLLPLVLFLVLAVFLAIGLTRDPRAMPSKLLDRPLPVFSLPQLDVSAPALTQNDLEGQVTLLNIFGSWCAACLEEHDLLTRISEQPGVNLIGVNWRDTREAAGDWLARHGDPYDQIIFDAESDLAIELGVTGAPETFIVDPDGRIRYKHVGPISDRDWTATFQPIMRGLEAE